MEINSWRRVSILLVLNKTRKEKGRKEGNYRSVLFIKLNRKILGKYHLIEYNNTLEDRTYPKNARKCLNIINDDTRLNEKNCDLFVFQQIQENL